ncbi:peptidylprolyl isomerase [Stappia stellulata]|uniref:peptidylprolyl isomerase n=1 Tax=Stappia stellulata TaxID=71235 RepID=UPI00040BDD2D|nr:peptidylprolyl isomerase [Stappia stellulata]
MSANPRTVFSVNGQTVAGQDTTPAAIETTVSVNGHVIDSRTIAAEAQNHEAPRGKPGLAWKAAANAVVLRTLLLEDARGRGLEPDPVEVGPNRYETEEEALIRALLEIAVEIDPPTEAEINAEWARDPDRFRAPPLWEVSHLLVACDPADKAQAEAARVRAVGLAQRALDDPAGFSRLASEHSDCGSKSSGGALGQLGPGDTVPEFEAVLRRLAEGEITPDPVPTRHGWHLIRMDAAAPGAVLPFEAVRDKIAAAMEKAAWAREARSFVNRLVASAEIIGADMRSV